jgi:UDP-N-acetylglucosamine diphosphorylase/glucosamine-1-phosphate N-acetyltransferase
MSSVVVTVGVLGYDPVSIAGRARRRPDREADMECRVAGLSPAELAARVIAESGVEGLRIEPRFAALDPDWIAAAARDLAGTPAHLLRTDGLPVGQLGERADEVVVVGPDVCPDLDDPWERTLAGPLVRRWLCRAHARRGVIFDDPDHVVLDATVVIAEGVRIGTSVVLRGATRIGAGATVDHGADLTDTDVGDGAVVKPFTVAHGATIGPRAQVGPFAHLREGTVLEDAVKVGNFVETKKAVLRPGAKASHLTYLGDCEVGPDANVGAGTITCNYDGYGKYRTEIGAGAFIGSNTALVAPVRVGAGAIIGAGSVITTDVPDESLAVERAPQRTFPGRAAGLRAKNAAKAGKAP